MTNSSSPTAVEVEDENVADLNACACGDHPAEGRRPAPARPPRGAPQMSPPSVSLPGLARMGEPSARRLLPALGSLTVWTRTSAKAVALSHAGARVAASPAEAAAP